MATAATVAPSPHPLRAGSRIGGGKGGRGGAPRARSLELASCGAARRSSGPEGTNGFFAAGGDLMPARHSHWPGGYVGASRGAGGSPSGNTEFRDSLV